MEGKQVWYFLLMWDIFLDNCTCIFCCSCLLKTVVTVISSRQTSLRLAKWSIFVPLGQNVCRGDFVDLFLSAENKIICCKKLMFLMSIVFCRTIGRRSGAFRQWRFHQKNLKAGNPYHISGGVWLVESFVRLQASLVILLCTWVDSLEEIKLMKVLLLWQGLPWWLKQQARWRITCFNWICIWSLDMLKSSTIFLPSSNP